MVPHAYDFKPVIFQGLYAVAVRVVVKLFAGLRERAGWPQREVDVPEGSLLGDLWPALELGPEPQGLLYAVNREYAELGRVLAEGDEVALIPPVSGGAFRITDDPLSLDDAVAEVAHDTSGAIATFTGTVRAASRGRNVQFLEYEAYTEMAESVMAGLAAVLKERYELHDVAIHHRVGRVEIGEASAPPRRAGRVQGRHRRAEVDRAALEERGVRGRRRVDRAGFVTAALSYN